VIWNQEFMKRFKGNKRINLKGKWTN